MSVAKLYYLFNPLDGAHELATNGQLQGKSQALKTAFGLSTLSDVNLMLFHNQEFRAACAMEWSVNADELSLHHLFRLARFDELNARMNRHLRDWQADPEQAAMPFALPYPAHLELQEGRFMWDEAKQGYVSASREQASASALLHAR